MKTKRKINPDNQPLAWLFVSPFVLGLIIFFINILTVSIRFSFSNISTGSASYEMTFVGLNNYKHAIISDVSFIRLVLSSVAELLYNTPIILLFSLFIAVLLNRELPGRTFFRAVFFLPVIVSTGIVATADKGNLVLQVLSNSSAIDTGVGATSSLLSTDSIENFFAQLNFSPTLIGYVTDAVNNIIDVIDRSGVQIIIFLAGLQSISPSVYEYAKTEGATGWDIFWKITFPLIQPMMLVNLFYTVIAFTTSDSNNVLTYIDGLSFGNAQFGIASAMAWLYFLVIAIVLLIVTGIILLVVKKQSNAERGN